MSGHSSDDAPPSIDLGNLVEAVVHAVGRAHGRLQDDRGVSPGKGKPPKAFGGNIVIRAWVSPEAEVSALPDDASDAETK